MSMIDCTACKKAISGNATACPNCGEPLKKPSGCLRVFAIASAACLALLWLAFRNAAPSGSIETTAADKPSAPVSRFASAPWMEPFDHAVLTKEQTRAVLKDKYLALYSVLQPNYNHMKASVRKHGKGRALWVEHSFFSKYEYQIGGNAIAVQTFISQHASALRHAGIVAVGARNPENDDWTGYGVK